jgi:hypothetical protein
MAWVIGLLVVAILALVALHILVRNVGHEIIDWLEVMRSERAEIPELKRIIAQQEELIAQLRPISSHYAEQEYLRREYERDREGP